MFGCRKHGPRCQVPWGYDEAHTDSARPYTLDELAEREAGPHRYAYPTVTEYEQAFYLWRALRVDARLAKAEQDAKDQVMLARMGINASSVWEAATLLASRVA
ncbi:hypothetical protein [Streptomyces sp. NPDC002994]|uniref:hypothetical protein n=1 Tax=Streptomyces sp. NPDC002994 TaxID=3154441 RepID=UPI0033B69095